MQKKEAQKVRRKGGLQSLMNSAGIQAAFYNTAHNFQMLTKPAVVKFYLIGFKGELLLGCRNKSTGSQTSAIRSTCS